MMMRRRGPGLIGAAARTAVIVGTANAVSHRQAERYAGQQAAPPEEAPQAAAPAAADDVAAQIEAMAKLHAEGILTDEEFSAKKAQLLGI